MEEIARKEKESRERKKKEEEARATSSFGGASAASSARGASSVRYNVEIEKTHPRNVKKDQSIPVKKYRSLQRSFDSDDSDNSHFPFC